MALIQANPPLRLKRRLLKENRESQRKKKLLKNKLKKKTRSRKAPESKKSKKRQTPATVREEPTPIQPQYEAIPQNLGNAQPTGQRAQYTVLEEEKINPMTHQQEYIMTANMPGFNMTFQSNVPFNFQTSAFGSFFEQSFNNMGIPDFFSSVNPFIPMPFGINFENFGVNFQTNFQSNFDTRNFFNMFEMMSMHDPNNAEKPPASKEAIKKLPVFKVESKHCKKGEKGNLEPPNCAICCSSISLGQKAQLLPCGHMFHPTCIKPWFQEHNTCPICRFELPTDDPIYESQRNRGQAPGNLV